MERVRAIRQSESVIWKKEKIGRKKIVDDHKQLGLGLRFSIPHSPKHRLETIKIFKNLIISYATVVAYITSV